MYADMHVHTKLSIDGQSSMEEYCKIALNKKVSHICFTEHVDFNKYEYSRWQFNVEEYFRSINALRKCFPELNILTGMEFSEPHLFQREFEALNNYDFDSIIGSVHHCDNGVFPGYDRLPLTDATRQYYKSMLEMVKFGQFQILGHMDFPRRYFENWTYDNSIIDEILKTIINRKIILEANTSTIKLNGDEPMPKYTLIQKYLNLGGKNIVLSSDAHCAAKLGNNFDMVDRNLDKTFKIGYVKNKVFHELERDSTI